MFRPVQLSLGNSAGGQFCKGRSKAHKQNTAIPRPTERREQHSGQQLAVDVDGTVSHSAVVAFLTGPVQMMLVHESVQHSLRFGQQLAGDQVTLPCRPRDWHVVNIPSPTTKTDTSSRAMKDMESPKQPSAVRHACSTPTSSPNISPVESSHKAKGTDSSAMSQPGFDAPTVVTTVQSITDTAEASVGFSSPDTTTNTINGPSPSLLADVPLSPATSSSLSALEESNSSTLCEDSLAITADNYTMWATSTWTYSDTIKVSDSPKQPSSASSPAASAGTYPETESPSATDIPKTNSCSKEVQDIIGSADAFVEVSLRPKHLTTKPLLSSSTPTAKLTQEPPRPDSTTPSDDKHNLRADNCPAASPTLTLESTSAAERASRCTTGGKQFNMLQHFCSTVQALFGQARWLMGSSTTTAAAPCCNV